jgi:hypothetical protein
MTALVLPFTEGGYRDIGYPYISLRIFIEIKTDIMEEKKMHPNQIVRLQI